MSANLNPIILGYACVNMTCKALNIRANRTMQMSRLKNMSYRQFCQQAIRRSNMNLSDLKKILEWNVSKNIMLYRMPSNILVKILDLKGGRRYDINIFNEKFQQLKSYCDKYGLYMSFHVQPYVVLNSPCKKVISNSIAEIEIHAEILSKIVPQKRGYIIIHVGGIYGDKLAALERFKLNYAKLSDRAKSYLVIENCERRYDVEDCLKLSSELHCPVVFDVFHHECTIKLGKKFKHTPYEYMKRTYKTWRHRRPKYHLSNQKIGGKIGAHSNEISKLPENFKKLNAPICVMLECKNKELSVIKLI